MEIGCGILQGFPTPRLGWKGRQCPCEECISHSVIFDPRWSKMWLHLQGKHWSVPTPLSVPEDKDSGLSIIIILPLALKQHVWIGNCLSLSLSLSLFLSIADLETDLQAYLENIYSASFSDHFRAWSWKHMFLQSKRWQKKMRNTEALSVLIFWWKVTGEIRKRTLRKWFWFSVCSIQWNKNRGLKLHLVSLCLLH